MCLPDIGGGQDSLMWTGDMQGKFTTSSAVALLRHKEPCLNCSNYIWNTFLYPSTASNVWKVVQGIYVDDPVMVGNGYELASRCCICENSLDNMSYILWDCIFNTKIWSWLCSVFEFSTPKYFEEIWNNAKHKIPLVKEDWITSACSVIKDLWFQNNRRIFENIKPNEQHFKNRIKKLVFEGGLRMEGNKWNQNYDHKVISFFNLGSGPSKFQCVKDCYWFPHSISYTMFCCDGSSFGNPGTTGYGVVIRDHLSQVIGVLSGGIGIATNYIAKNYPILGVVELAGE
ncbi:uncharacterized protein LOC113350619 [Papaver somniferum]|uniref:uncharacterized protein LOC113350619 n=1 Tax=Papaver somniferum TaxID=3469 RepID=UPI000E6FA7E0|nr:uncharacterized protein LOC113350619 [Papaver somniferum]